MRMGNRLRDALLLVLLSSSAGCTDLPTISHSDPRRPHHAIETGTCEAQAVNYVTHTPPAICSTGAQIGESGTATSNSSHAHREAPSTPPAIPSATVDGHEASMAGAAGPPFMSFEDWKEEMLKRTGQDPQELRSRRGPEPLKPGDRRLPDDTGTAWGDEEEIALDFGEYAQPQANSQGRGNDEPVGTPEGHARDPAIAYDQDKKHRSKDAGKTCKERFSYSSFDAGATILKTGSGTKNPKALLVENKDSYMLLECGRENKFVIVELSDDILLDTVVIANFEFFSSMIRHFRVSVSDRYPVKVDKWTELGTFEARNSRDIQAFLVENPQIWARYVRIEFLTHYGNEYYCPVSLIRIHGTRMLDSWKEADGTPGEDTVEDDDREARQCEDSVTESSVASVSESSSTQESQTMSPDPVPSENAMTSMDLFAIFAATCPALPTQLSPTETGRRTQNMTQTGSDITASPHHSFSQGMEPGASIGNATISDQPVVHASSSNRGSPTQHATDQARNSASVSSSTDKSSGEPKPATENPSKITQASQATKHPQSGSPGARSRGTPTSNAASASPTVQEGFFNSITKRLIQVESNLTLSMKYIEDQSRHVQEAMQRMEQQQSQRITSSLEVLNSTMFSELRTMREQYEHLLQSTLQALESQRDRNEQDAVALSARLNLLADEVVFQKRMAIAQAVLLLSCLFLVIFSRGVPLPYLTHPHHNGDVTGLASPRVHANVAQRLGTSLTDTTMSSHIPAVRLMTPESINGAGADQSEDISFETEDTRSESQYHAAHSRLYRPSPPPTPRAQVEEDFNYQDIVAEGSSSRLPASDQHNTRKPLPALPEHPFSL